MQQFKNIKKVGLGIICFEGTEHLYNIISTLRDSVGYVSIGLQRLSYHSDKISNVDLQEIFRLRDEDHLVDEIVEIELDTSKMARVQETDKRNILIQDAEDHGCSHVIIIDSDEYYTKKSFDYALAQIDEHDYEMTYCQYVNYYHDYTHYLKYPFEQGMYVPFVSKTKYRHSFECTDFTMPSDPTRRYVIPYDRIDTVKQPDGTLRSVKHYTASYHIFEWNEVKMHHLSWIRADIRKKMECWSSKKVFDNYDDLIDRSVLNYNEFDPDNPNAQAMMMFNTPDNKVDVASFPKQFIHPKVDIMTRLRPAKDYKKLLILSMSADMEPFNTLEKVSNETWRNINREKFKNLDVEFWTYTDAKDGQATSVDENNHIIYIKKDPKHGSLVNATYSKTIEAFHILIDKLHVKFDYLVRTNNSIWLNIPLLNEFLAYQHDDSYVFGAKLYAAFHSAFNIYAGGQLMIFSKRTMDILMKLAGSVNDAKQFETEIVSADDNMLCGKLNQRIMALGLIYDDIYHSVGGVELYKTDFNSDDIDFTAVEYQVKTFELPDNGSRTVYDSDKMYKIDRMWRERENDIDIDELYKSMVEKHYDKEIVVIKRTKTEWFAESDEVKSTLKLHSSMPRREALEFLPEFQKKCGYKQAIFMHKC